MLIIGLLKNIQQAMMNYRSRNQLRQLSKEALDDIALSVTQANNEANKASILVFLNDIIHPKNTESKQERE